MRERIIDFGWNSLSRGVGLAICVALIYASTGIINQIPCWLGAWWPAVVTHASWADFRDKDQGAFVLDNEKIAPGDPRDPVFHAQGQNGAFSPEIGLSAHRCDAAGARIEGPLPKHPVGQKWRTRYCFDMPGTFSVGDEIKVTGHLVHHRWFGELNEPVPPLTVCPVGMVLKKDECRPPPTSPPSPRQP